MASKLSTFFKPTAIAVLGASRDPRKWGQRVIRYTRGAGFSGEIFAVNPNASADDIPGATVIGNLQQATTAVSCAFLAVPQHLVLTEVERCCSLEIPSIVIAASGFGESSAEGHDLERRILGVARSSGARIVGPNCFGLFSAPSGVNLTPFEYPPAGRIALISQSGNIAAELFMAAADVGIGFSHCVGVGNQLDVGIGDLLVELAGDANSDAIAVYVEGLPDGGGPKFVAGLELCRSAGKPVVVIKAGTSTLAAAVAQTHTRSLAADDRVWDAVLSRGGAIRVASVAEMVDVLRCAGRLARRGPRIAVVTDGGGDSVLAMDALSRTRLQLARFSAETVARLDAMAPPAAPRAAGMNPLTLDTAGGVEDDPEILARCTEAIAQDGGADVILVAGLFGTYEDVRSEEVAAAEALGQIAGKGDVSLIFQTSASVADSAPLSMLAAAGIPFFQSMDHAFCALDRITPPHAQQVMAQSARSAASTPEVSRQLPIAESVALLRSFGVELPRMEVAADPTAVLSVARSIGYPVCLKIADPTVVHKSDVGGVYLNLCSPDEVKCAAEAVWAATPGTPLLVMPSFPSAFEILLGGLSDPQFGPVVIVGRGGVLAELDADTVLLTGDFSRECVDAALRSLRCYPALTGYRGRPPLAVDKLCDRIEALAGMLAENPTISVDLNPVLMYPDRCIVADVRVMSSAPPLTSNHTRELVGGRGPGRGPRVVENV